MLLISYSESFFFPEHTYTNSWCLLTSLEPAAVQVFTLLKTSLNLDSNNSIWISFGSALDNLKTSVPSGRKALHDNKSVASDISMDDLRGSRSGLFKPGLTLKRKYGRDCVLLGLKP